MSTILLASFAVLVAGSQARAQSAPCDFEKALSARDHAQLQSLIRGGCDPNAALEGRPRPLWSAFYAGDVDAIRFLLEHGADPNQRGPSEETILHSLTAEADNRLGELLVSKGANVDAQDDEGFTPLNTAVGARTNTGKPGCQHSHSRDDGPRCWQPNVRLIRFLLAHKARPDIANRYGVTPLHVAIADGLTNVAALMVDRVSDVQRKDNSGWTPLYLAARAADVEMVRRLLARGADPNVRDDDGNTPLHAASSRDKRRGARESAAELQVVRLLLAKGARPTERNIAGITPLHTAAHADARSIAHVLISTKVPVDLADATGAGPLHHAARRGHLRTVSFLLARDADVNRKDQHGLTPLHWFCRFPHARYPDVGENLKTLALLVARGARIEEPDADGRGPLYHCVSRGNRASVRFLLARGARPDVAARRGVTVLQLAAYQDDLGVFELLRESGAKLDARDVQGRTAGDWAAMSPSCDRKVARLLGKAGTPGSGRPAFDVCAPPAASGARSGGIDENGRTPLHLAALRRQPDAARALLASGAPPNARDRWGRSPLHLLGEGATDEYASVKMADILLKAGADAAARDKLGRTPLHAVADGNGDEEAQRMLADLLICRGADTTVTDHFGLTAGDVASVRGWSDSDLVKCTRRSWETVLRRDTQDRLMY